MIRLRPAPHCRTPVTAYSLKIEPAGHFLNWQQDPHSNYLARVVFPDRSDHFHVEVDLVAELTVINPFDFFLEPYAEKFPFRLRGCAGARADAFLAVGAARAELAALLKTVDRSRTAMIDFLVALNQKLQQQDRVRDPHGARRSDRARRRLTLGSGSCRDSAWLLVEILRHLGLAARFVSGYLIQLKPDMKPLDGPRRSNSDFTDLHAWTEVYLPGAGWVGLDPTSGLFAGEGHIPLAATPEPSAAAPVSGRVDPCEVTFAHEMAVSADPSKIRASPCPTPMSSGSDIGRSGDQVDRDICAGDIRLTMGGEPTFVSIDNMEGAEWNTAALGAEEAAAGRGVAGAPARAFRAGRAAALRAGQMVSGRTAAALGSGLLLAQRRRSVVAGSRICWRARQHRLRLRHRRRRKRFAETLARRLGLDPGYVMPAFEDPFYYLHQERQLPVNVDPLDNQSGRSQRAGAHPQGFRARAGYADGLSCFRCNAG